MVKGISTIIATILMLMIVIALAGTSYLFISGIFVSKTATAFEIVDSYGDTVIIRNIGTEPITSFRSAKLDNDDAIYRVDKQDTSLVGNWKFDEFDRTTATDSSGKGNQGTYYGETWNDGAINGATFASGIYGNALNFDGNDDYVSIPDNPSLSITGPFTLVAWIKVSRKGYETQDQLIVGKEGNYILNVFGTGRASVGAVEFWWSAAGGLQSTITVDDNSWHHIVGVWDGANQRIFIDGIPSGTRATSVAPTTNTYPLKIGEWATLSDRSVYGTIDDVRIYNRALSQSEIQADMNSPYPVNRTVAWYNFENDAKDRHNIVKGKAGAAMSFDGSNDYVNIANFQGLPSSAVTVEAWVYYNQHKSWNFVVGHDHWSYLGGWGLFSDVNGRMLFSITTNPNVANVDAYKDGLLTGAWYHLVGVYDGNYVRVYVNGVEGTAGALSGFTLDNMGAVTMGSSFGLYNFFPGKIDEVKIYNKALSEQEIKANYNIGSQINAGETATMKIYNPLSKGTHTLRLCTSSMCNTAYLTIN